jgi:hypothetical protein
MLIMARNILKANYSAFRVTTAISWFEWHDDARSRIAELRVPSVSDSRRVKVAILDSGIQLSPSNKDMYDFEPMIQYKSWVDQSAEWRDDAGHGTHLAVLLRKIAPDAILHVARVFKKRPATSSVQAVAQVKAL